MPDARRAYMVLDAINEHHEHLDMNAWTGIGQQSWNDWVQRTDNTPGWMIRDEPLIVLDQIIDCEDGACGTTACFAGWTALLEGYIVGADYGTVYDREVPVGYVSEVARRLLGIDAYGAHHLFHCKNDELEDTVAEIFGPRPEELGDE